MARMVLLALALLLTGCKDKGEAFVGHWVQVKVKEGKKASSLDIELDEIASEHRISPITCLASGLIFPNMTSLIRYLLH